MPGGAPLGNQNAAKGRMWRQAIERALAKRSESRVDMIQALEQLAEKLLKVAESGDVAALRELGDRMDGKAAQQVQLTGAENEPVKVELSWLQGRSLGNNGKV